MNNQFSAMGTAFKEFLRLVVLAIPSFLVGIAINAWTDDPAFATGIGGVILGILKSYDRTIHEDPETDRNGIVPF